MLLTENDNSVYVTRGDTVVLSLTAETDGSGESYSFKAGDVVRIKVFEKKNCENVVLQKDFGIEETTDTVELTLTGDDTRIGEIISKPVDYWYEVELNPDTCPQTIIGYDDEGPRLFKLMPEGKEVEDTPPITPEDIPVVDDELSLTSKRPVQNKVITGVIAELSENIDKDINEKVNAAANQVNGDISLLKTRMDVLTSTKIPTSAIEQEVADARVEADGTVNPNLGEAVRNACNKVTKALQDITPPGNLYDSSTNKEKTIINASGAEVTNNLYQTSDYIFLEAGRYWITLVSRGTTYLAKYDLDKKFKTNGRSGVTSNNLEISENCYIRLCVQNIDVSTFMLVNGTAEPAEYIPYGKKLNEKYIPQIPDSNIISVNGEKVVNESLRKEKTDFVKTNSNLINHMTVKRGYVISSTGVVKETAGYAITEKIYVKPSTAYTVNNLFRICYFDSAGTFITSVSPSKAGFTSTSPANAAYAIVALSLSIAHSQEWQMNEGDMLLAYERQHLVIDGYRLKDDYDVIVDEIKEFTRWDKTVVDFSEPFLLKSEENAITDADKNTSAIYGYYDELMNENPLYITKTLLGQNGNGDDIYRYDFEEPAQVHPGEFSNKKPKAILVSGTHPEFGGIYGLFNAMKEITNNEELIDLRRNVHFIVVPCINPYGINTKSRKNANGIDLARNYEVGFIPGTDETSETYSGTTPLSELECQYVDRVMSENADAMFFASCHSFQTARTNGVARPNDAIWGCAATYYFTNICEKLIDKMSRLWRNKYTDIIPQTADTFFGTTEVSAPHGSEGMQAKKYKIQGGTLEVCDFFRCNSNKAGTAFSISRNTETYINFIRIATSCFNSTDKKLI